MRVAYIISAYHYPEQLIRLVRRLNTPETSFFVHVDKRTDEEVYRQVESSLCELPNAHLLQRHKCHWGDFGHVRATLKGIDEIVSREIVFDYAILLTGQDYPIKSNAEIEQFLQENEGHCFLNYFPLPSDSWENRGLDRIKYLHVRVMDRYFKLPIDRPFPNGYRPFGGSSYWCLPAACIEYIHSFVNQNPAFVRFFRYVEVPDEIFFQTIVLNSPFSDSVVNDDLRYVDWKDPDAASPSILGKDDFEGMMSSHKLFARKFDLTVDAQIVDMIDAEILSVATL